MTNMSILMLEKKHSQRSRGLAIPGRDYRCCSKQFHVVTWSKTMKDFGNLQHAQDFDRSLQLEDMSTESRTKVVRWIWHRRRPSSLTHSQERWRHLWSVSRGTSSADSLSPAGRRCLHRRPRHRCPAESFQNVEFECNVPNAREISIDSPKKPRQAMIDKDWLSPYSHLNLIGHVIEWFHRLFRVFHLETNPWTNLRRVHTRLTLGKCRRITLMICWRMLNIVRVGGAYWTTWLRSNQRWAERHPSVDHQKVFV